MEFLVQLLIAAVEMGTPLLLATLGGVISERAGVINLGMEGLMLVGALTAFVVMLHTNSPILAVALAAIAGGLVTMLHGLVCLMLRANQIASGLALTLFGTGLSGLFGSSLVGKTFNPIEDIPIPFLHKIPLIGDAFTCVLRRYFNGQNIFKAHKLHLYQRLCESGWSHQNVAIIYLSSTFVLVLSNLLGGLYSLIIMSGIIFLIGIWLDQTKAIKFKEASNLI